MRIMEEPRSWLVLATQLPAHPAYLRVKIWRRLRDAGAVSLANGVHILPDEPRHRMTLEAVIAAVIGGGGQASLLSGTLLGGSEDPSALFRAARDADYLGWIEEADRLAASDVKSVDVARMQRRLDHIRAIDHIGTGVGEDVEARMAMLIAASGRHPDVRRAEPGQPFRAVELHGRTWVTRRGVGVDRIASAWLIRRFIDPRPRFRFVDPQRYVPQRRELRFDMAEGEFTHEQDRCSFETLIHRAGMVPDQALEEIAQIIHQLDMGDGKYRHSGSVALASEMAEICAESERDEKRLEAGFASLDRLHRAMSR
jgi:hypothetical protein